MSIEIKDINKNFGDFVALQDVSLSIPTGQLTALLGPSGGGKSTLLRIIAGLESADSGSVLIEGNEATHLPPQKRNVGFVFQRFYLMPTLSARENVELPMAEAGMKKAARRARALELLSYVGLAARADHRPAQLSGGEQQRVAIARAVANGPRLLLADEPTGNLDPHTAAHVFGILVSLVRASGLAALVATHNMELAARMDRRVTIRDGLIEPLD